MPRGGKPKVYDAELVARVEALYAQGHTQAEIGAAVGSTQKVVWRLMQRHGIKARVATKRDQAGDRNSAWRGESASYTAFHKRVEVARGTPRQCDRCGTTDEAATYDWANLTGDYADVNDYERMCRSCHRQYDAGRQGGGA